GQDGIREPLDREGGRSVGDGHLPGVQVMTKFWPTEVGGPVGGLLLLLLAAIVPAQGVVSPKPKVEIAFNRYNDYEEMVGIMRRIADAYPNLVALESIGKSYQGRDLWLATLGSRTGTPLERRPAMWIDANVHGNEIQGTEVCLYTLWYLTEHYARNDRVRELM